MKKSLLMLGLAVMFAVSCDKKKEEVKKEEAQVGATQEAVEEKVETISEAFADVPKFSNEETQKFAEEFATYYKELAEATKSADATKITELQQKGVELAKSAQEKLIKMSPEDAKLWAEWYKKVVEEAAQK